MIPHFVCDDHGSAGYVEKDGSFNRDVKKTIDGRKISFGSFDFISAKKRIDCLKSGATSFENAICSMDCASPSRVVVGTNGGAIHLLEKSIWKSNPKAHLLACEALRFFPSAKVLLSGGSDFQAKIFSLEEIDEENEMYEAAALKGGHSAGILSLGFIDVGRNVLTGDKIGKINIWDVPTQQVKTAVQNEGRCNFIATRENIAYFGNGKSIGILDTRDGKVQTFFKFEEEITSCCLNKEVIVFGSNVGHIFDVDLRKQEQVSDVTRFSDGSITSLFLENEEHLWMTNQEGLIMRRDNSEGLVSEEYGDSCIGKYIKGKS